MADTTAITHPIDFIEASGGWRLVLQGRMGPFGAAARDLEPEHAVTHPNAYLAVAYYLARRSERKRARQLYDDVHAAWIGGRLSAHRTLATELQIVDTHLGCYEDTPMGEGDLQFLQDILATLSADDHVGRAAVLNYMCFIAMHMRDFNFAQSYAEGSIRDYLAGDAEFGAAHLHTYLGQIRLARGDLVGAEDEYRAMAARLERVRPAQPELEWIRQSLQSEVAYEINDIERAESLLASGLEGMEDDAWFDILASAYRVSTRVAMVRDGLPGALSALAHAEVIATRRDMPRLHRLIQIERIRALTLGGELDLARDEVWKAGLNRFIDSHEWELEADWAMRLGPIATALARFLVLDRRAPQALVVLNVAEDNAIRSGNMLAVAKLRVIRSLALWRMRQRSEAAGALVSGIRLLGNQPFRRFILDEGPHLQEVVQAILDSPELDPGSSALVRARLKELNHHWTIQTSRPGRRRGKGPLRDADMTDPTRQQYLQLLAIGQSNKEIGRALGVSQNTVKYHLKVLFRDLGVDNRIRAVNRARELGLLE